MVVIVVVVVVVVDVVVVVVVVTFLSFNKLIVTGKWTLTRTEFFQELPKKPPPLSWHPFSLFRFFFE